MGKSQRVRFSELRKAYRLIHECRDLGHDRTAWCTHAAQSLPALVGAQVATVMHARPRNAGGVPEFTLLCDHGWPSSRQRAFWYERYALKKEFTQASTFQKFSTLSGPLLTRSREQLVGDRAWYNSSEFQEMHRELGLDDLLASCRRWMDPPRSFGFTLLRPLGEKKHGASTRRLLHLFMDELSRHLGKSLALEAGGIEAALPPYLRQTLACLLEGDSEKQAAARLGLSRHTVHDYVTELYRRLGVSSRGELMALCLKRRTSL